MSQREAIARVLDDARNRTPLDHLPVLFLGRHGPMLIGFAASTRGADVLIGAAHLACLYVSRARHADGREFFIGHN